MSALVGRQIQFLVSPEAANTFEEWDVDWSSVSESYRNEMHKRVRTVLDITETTKNLSVNKVGSS